MITYDSDFTSLCVHFAPCAGLYKWLKLSGKYFSIAGALSDKMYGDELQSNIYKYYGKTMTHKWPLKEHYW